MRHDSNGYMFGPGAGSRLLTGLALAGLLAGCAGSASSTQTSIPPSMSTSASASAGRTATIGQPADDGARIIAVDANPPVIHCLDTSCSTPTYDPATRARDLTIDSPAVGIVKVRLLLPGGFDSQPATRWPVLYLLTGGPGMYSDWTEYSDIETLAAPKDLLVVMPDDGDGFYSDYWNYGMGGPPMWETFHLVELRQLIERNWHAGDKRAMAGVSMGGYGAIEYAARQPGMFLFAGSFSGPLDPVGGRTFVGGTGLTNDIWGDPLAQADVWKAHDPTVNAAGLNGTALYVAYGNGQVGPLDNGHVSGGDPTGSTEAEIALESASFVNRLAELKIPVTVDAYGNGTHSQPYFERDLHNAFPLILKALGE